MGADRPARGRCAAALLAVLLSVGGCNLVTGADDIRLVSDPEEGATSGSGGTASTGAGGGDQPSVPLALADSISIVGIDLYQGVRRPLMADGSAVTSSIPVVVGRPAMMRVFYETESDFGGGKVTARLTIDDEPPVDVRGEVAGSSTHDDLASTLNIEVPGSLITPGASYRLELLQPEPTSGDNDAASYPRAGGDEPLGAESSGTLKIVLVPVRSGSSLPDTSPEQLERYTRLFNEQYPASRVVITLRQDTYDFAGDPSGYNGLSWLLDEICQLRQSDAVGDDVYYYGIHGAGSSGVLGLGFVGDPGSVWTRCAVGVGDGARVAHVAVHEIGHTHGRMHAPCGGANSTDPSFPHAGGGIGAWGYSASDKALLDPTVYSDIMGYCEARWVSDYTFTALFERIRFVNGVSALSPDPVQRSYDRIRVLDGEASLRTPLTLRRPPGGTLIEVSAQTAAGQVALTGHFFAYDHLDGGVMLLPRQPHFTSLDAIRGVAFVLDGRPVSTSRRAETALRPE